MDPRLINYLRAFALFGCLGFLLPIGCTGKAPKALEIPAPVSTEGMDSELVQEINRLTSRLSEENQESEDLLVLAKTYQANDLSDLAISSYKLYLGIQPNDAKAWYYLGLLHRETGDTQQAADCLQRSRSLAAHYSPIYWRLALAILDLPDCGPEALELCDQAIRIAPDDDQAHCVKARALIDTDKPAEALSLLRQRKWREKGILGYVSNLERTASRMCGEKAISQLDASATQVQPIWSDPWQAELLEYERGASKLRMKADLFFSKGRFDNAIETLEKLTHSPEASGRDWNMLGSCYYYKGKPNEAIQAMQTGLKKFPEDTDSLLNLARLYHSLGRRGEAKYLDEAWQTADQHSKLLPDHWESIDLKGQICQFRKESERALTLFEQASGMAKSLEACHWHRIMLLLELRQVEQARVLLEGIPVDFQTSPYYGYCAAELARQRGDWESASEILSQIALGAVQDPVLAKKLKDLSIDLKYGS